MNDVIAAKPLDKLLAALANPASSTEIAKRLLPSDVLQTDDYHFFQDQ